MGIIATAIEHMIAAGMSGAALVSAVADMEAALGASTHTTNAAPRQRAPRAGRNAASQSVTR